MSPAANSATEARVVNIPSAFDSFHEHWSPRIAGHVSGHEVRLAKLKGEFIWHKHDDADELFFIQKGAMRMELRDRVLELKEGDMVVIPAGVEHRPVADEECCVFLVEPAGTLNTGEHADSERTLRTLKTI
jgi:mannose-6-phosphate isomerase-like protein (cupin superfamily)